MNTQSWHISLGIAPVPRNLYKVNVVEQKPAPRKKVRSQVFVYPDQKKAMMAELVKMAKMGIDDRTFIYDALYKLGVLPKSGDKYLAITTVWKYIKMARKEVGYVYEPKSKKIVELFDSGMDKKQIEKTLKTGPWYIRDCLAEAGRIKRKSKL